MLFVFSSVIKNFFSKSRRNSESKKNDICNYKEKSETKTDPEPDFCGFDFSLSFGKIAFIRGNMAENCKNKAYDTGKLAAGENFNRRKNDPENGVRSFAVNNRFRLILRHYRRNIGTLFLIFVIIFLMIFSLNGCFINLLFRFGSHSAVSAENSAFVKFRSAIFTIH